MARNVYFVDRNVISKIKGRSLKDDEEIKLRSIDQGSNSISAILASFEGQIGVLQNVAQLKESIEKDTAALSSFFKFARTDDMARVPSHPEFLEAIVERQQERWTANEEFIGYVQRRLYQPIAKAKLQEEKNLITKEAQRLNVPLDCIFVLCAISCLYGQEDAREILKPSLRKGGSPNHVHNALQDLASINLYHTLSMMLQLGAEQTAVEYITFDGWLHRFMQLTNSRPGGLVVTDEMLSRSNVDLSREMFPRASEEEFKDICELLGAVDNQRSYSATSYPTTVRIKIDIPR
jgi:hypothetical protein